MIDEKQAALLAIQKINAVDGFDPTPLAVEYVDIRKGAYPSRLLLPRTALSPLRESIPVTPIRPTNIWLRRLHRGATWQISRQYPHGNGRRPLQSGLPFEMQVLDFSSVRLVILSTRRL